MTNIRRYYLPHTPIFITAVCYQRRPLLRHTDSKELLLAVMREVKQELPFQMLAYVLLDDHFHWLILPQAPNSYPRIMQSVKLRFARRCRPTNAQRKEPVWQRRYWDHIIRNQTDLHNHLDYIHINPVKHGLTNMAAEYRWSSFDEYQRRGRYPSQWGETDLCKEVTEMNLE